MTSAITFRMGIFSNILVIAGALGLSGFGSGRLDVLDPERHTVAPWYVSLANRSRPASGPSESKFLLLNTFDLVSRVV